MTMRVLGASGSSPTFSQPQTELDKFKRYIGLHKSELEKLQGKFERTDSGIPDGLKNVIRRFDRYDKNNDEILSISELSTYAMNESSSLATGSQSLIGVGDGTTLEQLQIMQQLASSKGYKDKNISTLVKSFDQIDINQDGKIGFNEYDLFTEKNDLITEAPKDQAAMEEALVKKAIKSYSVNARSSMGFLVELFVAEA